MSHQPINWENLPQKAPDYDLKELFEAGMHFGHRSYKWHPKMAPYIYMEKNGVHIFDLEKTAAGLKQAYNLVYHLASQGKTVLMVGTKTQAREIVEAEAAKSGISFIVSRWLGGLLTNWKQVSKSLKKMLDIEQKLEDGSYKGYTKYEITQVEKELSRLKRFFRGLSTLTKEPDCLLVIDPQHEAIAVAEANKKGVPVIALVDSNTDPSPISVVIAGNDDAVNSIQVVVKTLNEAYVEGKKQAK